jgi:hypothetical protein
VHASRDLYGSALYTVDRTQYRLIIYPDLAVWEMLLGQLGCLFRPCRDFAMSRAEKPAPGVGAWPNLPHHRQGANCVVAPPATKKRSARSREDFGRFVLRRLETASATAFYLDLNLPT